MFAVKLKFQLVAKNRPNAAIHRTFGWKAHFILIDKQHSLRLIGGCAGGIRGENTKKHAKGGA